MICRIFLFMGIAKIFKNTPKVCGKIVALWGFLEGATKLFLSS